MQKKLDLLELIFVVVHWVHFWSLLLAESSLVHLDGKRYFIVLQVKFKLHLVVDFTAAGGILTKSSELEKE